jgi:4-hydroxy-4-methyl-2-oxoglutarate aldolase
MPESMPAGPVIQRAARHSSATLHEAAGRRGALPAAIKPVAPGFRVCGPAFVVSCASGDNLAIHDAISAASRGDVLVVDVGGPEGAEFGYWGEILSEAALAGGLGGVVLDGGARDSDRLAEIRFPVFARSVCIRGTVKAPRIPGTSPATVRIGDVEVRSGDIVVGDSDGVVVIPLREADQILAQADERELKEAAIIQRLRNGESTLQIYGWG